MAVCPHNTIAASHAHHPSAARVLELTHRLVNGNVPASIAVVGLGYPHCAKAFLLIARGSLLEPVFLFAKLQFSRYYMCFGDKIGRLIQARHVFRYMKRQPSLCCNLTDVR